jgi:hypothetical protein
MANAAPGGCDWCGNPLTGRATRWCSRRCSDLFQVNHVWTAARDVARKKARVNGIVGEPLYRCAHCGGLTNRPEVNHIDPVLGKHGQTGCWHHQDGLEVVCHACHVVETNRQFGRSSTTVDGQLSLL